MAWVRHEKNDEVAANEKINCAPTMVTISIEE